MRPTLTLTLALALTLTLTLALTLSRCVTLFMKLVSYAHVHRDLRLAEREMAAGSISCDIDASHLADLAKPSSDLDNLAPPPSGVPPLRRRDSDAGVQDTDAGVRHYPESVSLRGLLYFVLAPTLCYQVRKVRMYATSLRNYPLPYSPPPPPALRPGVLSTHKSHPTRLPGVTGGPAAATCNLQHASCRLQPPACSMQPHRVEAATHVIQATGPSGAALSPPACSQPTYRLHYRWASCCCCASLNPNPSPPQTQTLTLALALTLTRWAGCCC